MNEYKITFTVRSKDMTPPTVIEVLSTVQVMLREAGFAAETVASVKITGPWPMRSTP